MAFQELENYEYNIEIITLTSNLELRTCSVREDKISVLVTDEGSGSL